MTDLEGVDVLNPSAPTLPERFWDKAALYPSGCLVWQAALNAKGYGIFNIYGRTQLAHRLSYVEAKGEIPDHLEIDHLCRVRACVNPEHLEAVTSAENNRRKCAANPVTYITHEWEDKWGAQTAMHADLGYMVRRCPMCRAATEARSKKRRLGTS